MQTGHSQLQLTESSLVRSPTRRVTWWAWRSHSAHTVLHKLFAEEQLFQETRLVLTTGVKEGRIYSKLYHVLNGASLRLQLIVNSKFCISEPGKGWILLNPGWVLLNTARGLPLLSQCLAHSGSPHSRTLGPNARLEVAYSVWYKLCSYVSPCDVRTHVNEFTHNKQ